MLFSMMVTEILKYRRTLVPWLVAGGGFFPAFVALLFLLTGNLPVTWEDLSGTGLNFMNMLALLLIAIFTGHAFVSEYHNGRMNLLFSYPVPRIVLFVAKLVIVLLLVLSMYLVFFTVTATVGWIFIGGEMPELCFVSDMLGLLLMSAAVSFPLVPLTALLSMTVKNAGAYILTGVGYFIVYMSFAGSELGKYITPCVPDRLLKDYLTAGQLMSADTGHLLSVSAAIFLLLFGIAAACYVWWEN